MSYIEGIGDEVLLIFIILVLVAILSVIWFSTSVTQPRISVIVVDSQRFQNTINRIRRAGIRIINLNRNLGNNSNGRETGSAVTIASTENRDELAGNEGIQSSSSNEADNGIDNPPSTSSVQEVDKESIKESATASLLNISSNLENRVVSDITPIANSESTQNNCNTNSSDTKNIINTNNTDGKPVSLASITRDVNSSQSVTADEEKTPHSDGVRTKNDDVNISSEPSTSTSSQAEEVMNSSSESQDAGHIRVKLMYLDQRQKTVQVRPQQTVGEFKRNHFASELAEDLMIRLIHNGQELRPDTKSLQAYNIKESSVIHCLLSSNNTQSTNNRNQGNNQDDDDLNIGSYIFPLFGVILGLIWYSRVAYGRYFNAMSTLSLVGITFMYVIALLATFRTMRDNTIPPVGEIHEHED